MRAALAFALALGIVAADVADADARRKVDRNPIYLDGIPEEVYFNDGDSFRVVNGPRQGQKARLKGYNTLESWGPVHFWGDFHGWDLYRTHKEAAKVANGGGWDCETDGEVDGYGRMLVDCPELRRTLVSKGLAHVYAYGEEIPDPELVKVQLDAQRRRVGMWAKGIPVAIITSTHSIDAGTDGSERRETSYMRLADTRTGKTFTVPHSSIFRPCDVFCHSGSCMVYVPFDARYGENRPECMQGNNGERNRMAAAPHLREPIAEARARDRY